jgi:hypothetical protein
MYRYDLGTQETERSSTNYMDDVIDTTLSTFEAILPAVKIGGGLVNWARVITRTFYVCCSQWELIIIFLLI